MDKQVILDSDLWSEYQEKPEYFEGGIEGAARTIEVAIVDGAR
jgi:hypothetical protein